MHTRKFDAADEASVKAVVDDAIKAYGRLDIFFANAGVVGQTKVFTDITADEVLATLRTNVVRSAACIILCIIPANYLSACTLLPSTQLQP